MSHLTGIIENTTNNILCAMHNYLKSVLPEDALDHDVLDTHMEPYVKSAVARALVNAREADKNG